MSNTVPEHVLMRQKAYKDQVIEDERRVSLGGEPLHKYLYYPKQDRLIDLPTTARVNKFRSKPNGEPVDIYGSKGALHVSGDELMAIVDKQQAACRARHESEADADVPVHMKQAAQLASVPASLVSDLMGQMLKMQAEMAEMKKGAAEPVAAKPKK